MENTRYYNVTNESFFWCPARKDDQQEANDGRFLRKYKAFGEEKERWGWKTPVIEGLIEFAKVDTGEYQDMNGEPKASVSFQVAVQSADRVEVLNIKFYDGNPDGSHSSKANARRLVQMCNQIDLQKPVKFELSEEQFETSDKKTVVYYQLNISQGKFLSWSWTKKNGLVSEIPAPEQSTSKFGTSFNYEKQNDFFMDKFEQFVKKVELDCAGIKASREPTPAEAEKTKQEELAVAGESF